MKITDTIKSGLAFVADKLADVGARIPGVAQITIAAGPVAVTVQPVPPQPSTPNCPTCGR